MAHAAINGEGRDGGARGDHGKRARAAADPNASRGHGGADQQGERRIARHGIIFLRGGKREENQHEAEPAERQQARAAGAVNWLEGKFGDGREINAPGKQPDQMEQPEIEARDGIVIARVAKIQKAQKLLIDEEKPEKAVILAGTAVEREDEIRRIAQRGQDVPGRGDQTAMISAPVKGCRRFQIFAGKSWRVRSR